MHLQADHFSRLSEDMEDTPIHDRLMDDNLFVGLASPNWYPEISKFLTTQRYPVDWTKDERRKVESAVYTLQ